MRRVHIIGKKNHGKTTLIEALVAEYCQQGLNVGTIKHTHHQHEFDTPGKDSHRHRSAGAAITGIASRYTNAVFWSPVEEPTDSRTSSSSDAFYENVNPLYSACDIVLVEGDLHTDAPKVEVWRAVCGTDPHSAKIANFSAVITDDALPTDIPIWLRSNVASIAASLLQLVQTDSDIAPGNSGHR